MKTSDVVLVIIGPNWITARDEAGKRRLQDEADTHRAEIAAALAADVRIVPVLVGGAEMPSASELPEALRDLAYRNAAVIDDRRFSTDVRILLDSLGRLRPSRRIAADAERAGSRRAKDGADDGAAGLGGEDRGAVVAGRTSQAGGPRTLGPPPLSLPGGLAAVGAAVTLIWGVLVPRAWHPELWGLRAGAVIVLVAAVALGLWVRQWRWVMIGGVLGLLGLALWTVQLLATGHSAFDLWSLQTDGVVNILTALGVLAVLAAALVGMRPRRGPGSVHQ